MIPIGGQTRVSDGNADEGLHKVPGATPSYPPEFKREAVRLVRSSPNRSVAQIAREIGVSDNSLKSWVKQFELDLGEREGLTTEGREELRKLRKEMRVFSFGKRLEEAGIVPSMGRTGSALDNAISEGLVASLKRELLHRHRYLGREASRTATFDYIEGFYNRVRRHSSLGYLSPADHEQATIKEVAVALEKTVRHLGVIPLRLTHCETCCQHFGFLCFADGRAASAIGERGGRNGLGMTHDEPLERR